MEKEICTVVLVSYNHAEYFEQCIESVLSQKCNYEYIINVFDDASTDGTQEIIKQFEKKYPGKVFAYFSEKNEGAQSNFWKAFNSVKTKYCIFTESDDYWCDENKLQLQIDALENYPECSFCGHNTLAVNEKESVAEYANNRPILNDPILQTKKIFGLHDFYPQVNGGYIPYISARLIRTSCLELEKIRYKEAILFDFCQFYWLLLKGRYFYINRAMSVYRRTGAGTCSSKSPLVFLNDFYQNAIDFNKQTKFCIADKIFSDCILQSRFRLDLYNQANQVVVTRQENESTASTIVIQKRISQCLYSKIKRRIKDSLKRNIPRVVSLFSPPVYEKRVLEILPRRDSIYLLCTAGLGDTFLTAKYLPYLQEKFQSRIVLLIKKSHEVVMRLTGVADYEIVDFHGVDLNELSRMNPEISKGKIFPAHPYTHKSKWEFFEPICKQLPILKFEPWFRSFFHLSDKFDITSDVIIPDISDDLKKKLLKVGEIEKIILISPEATSVVPLDNSFWIELVQSFKKEGFIVVCNTFDKRNAIRGTIHLDLNSEELLELAYHCRSVHSIRSGLCDLLADLGDRLHVYYPTPESFYIYSLNDMFKRKDINETVVSIEVINE